MNPMNTETQPYPKSKPAKKRFGWPFWLSLVIGSIALIVCIAPIFIKRRDHGCDQTEQTSNARQIGLALLEFETEYGSFPSDATAARITAEYPDHGCDLRGRSSNSSFRQLFASGLTQSEAMFYAKVDGARKPDGDIRPGKLLEKGEVGFAYIAGLSSSGNPARPISFAPFIPGTGKFDPEPFDGKAVFLRVDNSAISMPIEKDGRVLLNGIDILSVKNPIWGDKAPESDIRNKESRASGRLF